MVLPNRIVSKVNRNSSPYIWRVNGDMEVVLKGQKILVSFLLLVTLFISFLLVPLNDGTLGSPPELGDGPDYDCIAYQLAQGNGFSFDWDDAGFRKPYEGKSDYSYLFKRTGKGITTYRPPLLPVIMATSYTVFGRAYQPIRVMICLMMALSATILFTVSAERVSYLAAITITLFFVTYNDTWYYSNLILTEAPACFVSAALLWSLLRFEETRCTKWAFVAGLLAAIAFYARSVLVFWFPVIAFIIFWLNRDKMQKTPLKTRLMPVLVFVFSYLLITTPWFVRNCVVLETFAPLGTMGMKNMAIAYSDEALNAKGRWFAPTGRKPLLAPPKVKTATLIDGEKASAVYNQSLGMKWIKNNAHKVPLLMGYRVADTWRPETMRKSFLYIFMLLGIIYYPVKRHLPILLGIVIANTIAVAFTWSVGGRFLFPVLPFMAMLAGGGLYGSIQSFLGNLGIVKGFFSRKQI